MTMGEIAPRVGLAALIYGGLIFIPAGTLRWPEAWLVVIIYSIFSVVTIISLNRTDPNLLRARLSLSTWPVRRWDRIIVVPLRASLVALFVLAGLDRIRYHWSQVSVQLHAVGFCGIVFALGMVYAVLRENTFASRIVVVRKGGMHTVVSTGPYAWVRHPMYAGGVVGFLGLPLALGSLYALIGGVLWSISIATRAWLEDGTLRRELPGYAAYARRVRYRIIPGIW